MMLEGKVALVTGSSRGIGAAIAIGFAREGATVIVNCRSSEDRGREVLAEVRETSPRSDLLVFDVSDWSAVGSAVMEISSRFGRIDVLVNNAGVLEGRPLLEIDEELVDRTFAVNVKGSLCCLQKAAALMKEAGGGSIINVSSISQSSPFFSSCHYAMSKASLLMLTRCAALELGPFGIRVNSLIPGIVETEIDPAYQDDALMRRMRAIIPLRRIGAPRDLVGAAVFLASDTSRYVTGTDILVDGGFSLFQDKNPSGKGE
jgi:NAD(P)-dependent dehydrogenase (short-subunit alcohol dehydrogenase family)